MKNVLFKMLKGNIFQHVFSFTFQTKGNFFISKKKRKLFIYFDYTIQHAGSLVPQPAMESEPPAVKAWSLNHWPTRKIPKLFFKIYF